jgi:hypothetical protein
MTSPIYDVSVYDGCSGSLLSTVFGFKPKDESEAAKSGRSVPTTPHGAMSKPNTPRNLEVGAASQRGTSTSQKKTAASYNVNNTNNPSPTVNGKVVDVVPSPQGGQTPPRPGLRGSLQRQQGGSLGGLDALKEDEKGEIATLVAKAAAAITATTPPAATGADDEDMNADDDMVVDDIDDEEVVANGDQDMAFDEDGPASSTLNSTTRSLTGTWNGRSSVVMFTLTQLRQACSDIKMDKRLVDKLIAAVTKKSGGSGGVMASPASSMRSVFNTSASASLRGVSASSSFSTRGTTPSRPRAGSSAASGTTPVQTGRRTSSIMNGHNNPSMSLSGGTPLTGTIKTGDAAAAAGNQASHTSNNTGGSHNGSNNNNTTNGNASVLRTLALGNTLVPATVNVSHTGDPGSPGASSVPIQWPKGVTPAKSAATAAAAAGHTRRPSVLGPKKPGMGTTSSGSLTSRVGAKPVSIGGNRPSSAVNSNRVSTGSSTARPLSARPKIGAAPKRASTGTSAPVTITRKVPSASAHVEPVPSPIHAAVAATSTNDNNDSGNESKVTNSDDDVKKSSSLLSLERAQVALNTLQRNDFTAIKRMANAPRAVRMAIEATAIVLGARPAAGHKHADAFWAPAQALLVKPNILTTIKSFNIHSLTPEV